MNKQIAIALVSCLFAVGIYINSVLKLSSNRENTSTDAEQQYQLLSIASNTRTRVFDREGNLSYRFQAQGVRQFGSSTDQEEIRYLEMDKPEITYYEPKATWLVTATRGTLHQYNKTTELNGEVRIQHWQTGKNDDVIEDTTDKIFSHLKTPHLTIQPELKLAHTKEPVKIELGPNEINAKGMTLDMANKKISFHSEVNAVHVPQ